MDCREVQNRISSYIDGTMPMNELREFLKHVEHCGSCYDELDTFFIVNNAVKRLEADGDDDFNMGDLLRRDIRRRKHMLRRHRMVQSSVAAMALLVSGIAVAEIVGAFGLF